MVPGALRSREAVVRGMRAAARVARDLPQAAGPGARLLHGLPGGLGGMAAQGGRAAPMSRGAGAWAVASGFAVAGIARPFHYAARAGARGGGGGQLPRLLSRAAQRGFQVQPAKAADTASQAASQGMGWYGKLGIGTVIFGSPLAYEHRRRGNLPAAISSHGAGVVVDQRGSLARGLAMAYRAAHLWLLFFPAALLAPLGYLLGGEVQLMFYRSLRRALELAGAAFIKWGQWASTRADMFPKAMCHELSRLHQGAPEHGYAYTVRCIEEEFGKPMAEIFHSFEARPIASGSVAQVYKASLRGGDGHVAVKVRHPGVEEQIRSDFALMSTLAAMVSWVPGMKWLNLESSLDQFSGTMARQVDLQCEADHLTRFNHFFWGRQGVSFPRPVHPLVSPAVLVESFEPAPSVSDFTAGRVAGDVEGMSSSDCEYVVRTGKDIYLQMLLADNFMHADLHPGNILLRRDEGRVPQLVLVDAGMVAELCSEEQANFIGFFKAMGAGDGEAAGRSVLSFAAHQTCKDEGAFLGDMSGLFGRICRGFQTDVDIGEVLRSTLELIRVHQVRIDANYATLVVNVLCIEGIARELQPAYNLLDGSAMMLRAHSLLGTRVLASAMPMWNLLGAASDEWELVKRQWAARRGGGAARGAAAGAGAGAGG